jgi:hypothetical protein
MNATKTISEIMADEEAARKEWEARETYKDFTVETLRKVTDAVFSQDHWKKPWAASVHHSLVMAVMAGTSNSSTPIRPRFTAPSRSLAMC